MKPTNKTCRKFQELILKSVNSTDKPCPKFFCDSTNCLITFERILRALGNKCDQFAAFKIRNDGTQLIMFDNKPAIPFNLGHPAHLQSEETLLKLIEILS